MTFIEERAIIKKRKCKHGCGTEIYLQYIPVTPTLRWIAFDSTTGEIHSCPNKPFDSKIRKLIGKAIERMNYHNTNTNNISLLLNGYLWMYFVHYVCTRVRHRYKTLS